MSLNELELRQLLGCFLFSGDDVFKKIKVLSGGEKARVALAKVIAAKGNFLMLDEPTNHLDMQSVEMLIDALQKYEGTLIFVSHDRYFINKTANKIWHIEHGKVKEFVGGYEEYVQWEADKQKRLASIQQAAAAKAEEIKLVEKPKVQPKPQVNNNELQQLKKEHQNKSRAFQKLESEVEKMKGEKAEIEAKLADPSIYANKDEFKKLDDAYKLISSRLEGKTKEYEKLLEEVMELEEKIGS
jgi:ATP-binding cassette, subfamily F, member 3